MGLSSFGKTFEPVFAGFEPDFRFADTGRSGLLPETFRGMAGEKNGESHLTGG